MEELNVWDDTVVEPEAEQPVWDVSESNKPTPAVTFPYSRDPALIVGQAIPDADPVVVKQKVEQDPDALVADAAKIVQGERITALQRQFNDATAAGNTEAAVASFNDILKANQEYYKAAPPVQSYTTVTEQAVKNMVAEDPRTKVPEGGITGIVDEVVAEAQAASGKGFVVNFKKYGEFAVKDILLETFTRPQIISSASDAFGLVGNKALYYANTNTMREDARAALDGMSDEQKFDALNKFVKYAKDDGVSEVAMLSFVTSMLTEDETDRMLTAIGDIAGPIGDLLMVGGIVVKGAKGVSAISTIAKAGGGNKAGKVIGESLVKNDGLIQAEEAIAFAQKLSPENVLPTGSFGTSSQVQQKLYDDTSKLLADLKDRIASQTVYSHEVDNMVKELRATFDPNINTAIRAFDVDSTSEAGIASKVTWANKDGTAFASEDAARLFAERQGLSRYEIIPDTSNAGFAVRADVLDAYRAELSTLTSKLDSAPKAAKRSKTEKVVYHGSVSETVLKNLDEKFIGTGEGGRMEGHGFYFSDSSDLVRGHANLAGQGTVYKATIDTAKMFPWNGYVSEASKATQNGILKAIKEIAPDQYGYYKNNGLDLSGKELYRDVLQGYADPKRASDVLAKHGVQGHFYDNMGEGYNYNAITQGVEGYHTNYVVYPGGKPFPLEHIGGDVPKFGGDYVWSEADWSKVVAELNSKKHTYDNVFSAKTGGVLSNATNTLKVSPSVGKKATAALVEWRKMLGMENNRMVVVMASDAKKLAGKFRDMDIALTALGKSGEAVHFVHDGRHYLVLKNAVNTNEGLYNLAHEFGHAFDHLFRDKYRKEIDSAYVAWKKEHLPGKGAWAKVATPEEVIKMHSFRQPGHVEVDFKAWAEFDPAYRQWMVRKDEWFAEQFANWLLTDHLPRSKFEHLLQSLMDSLTKLANDVAERIGIPVNQSPKFVKKFLNEHMTSVEEGNKKLLESAIEFEDIKKRIDELTTLIAEGEKGTSLPSHGYLVREYRDDVIKYDALTGFKEEDIQSSFWVGIDPKHLVSEFLVEGRVIGIHSEAKVMKSLSDFMIEAVSPLNKKELQKVYATLKKGDAYSEAGDMGKEFNATELTTMGLAEKEQEAYFKLRTARNIMFELKDREYVLAMRKQGFQQIGIDFGGGKSFVSIGKVIDAPTEYSTVYDVRRGEQVVADAEYIQSIKDAGGKFVKLEEVHAPTEKGKTYRTFVVDPDNSKIGDVTNVLHRRTGEFSRIYTDEYFITVNKSISVDGKMEAIKDTIHTARTKKEAEEFVSAMNYLVKQDATTLTIEEVDKLVGRFVNPDTLLKELKDGVHAGSEYAQHYNRITDDYVTNFTKGLEGSLFTGRRGQRLTSISEDKENIQDIFQSLQAEIANTARVLGRTDWRNAAITRWYNEAMKADALPNHVKGVSPMQAFEWAGQADFHYVGSGKQGKFLERTHKYIRMQLGMKTKDEQLWEEMTRALSERYMQDKLEPVGKALRQTSPARFLRTINFHTMLGFMNPSQLIVQTMGAVAGIALHPVYGVFAGKSAPILRMALMSDNPEVWKTFAKVNNFTEFGFGDVDDFINTVKAIRKSGILDGINSTSLYNIEDGAYNVFSKTRRVAGKSSLWTFNRGEEMARIISFDIARREWKAANEGMDFLTDDALRSILVRTDDLTQNMTKANEAFFQRGALSIPTQFLQYQVKLYANIMHAFATKKGAGHRGFTRMEATKILAGHIVLFGLANNGFGAVADEVFGKVAEEAGLNENQRYVMSQGLIAGLLDSFSQAVTGEELKTGIGARLATFDWYLQFSDALTEKRFLEVAAGPSYSWVRSGDKVANVLSMWVQNPDVTFGEVLDGIKQISESQISTLRNATKAYVAHMHDNMLQSNRGDDIATLSNMELIAQALGIAPVEQVELNKMNKTMTQHYDSLRELVNVIAIQQQRSLNARLDGDNELADQLANSAMVLLPTNAGDREFVLKELMKAQKSNKGYNEAVAKYLLKDSGVHEPFTTQPLGGN